MPNKTTLAIPANALHVWVLAPYVLTNDANLDYYYDFTQSIAEYTTVFAQLGVSWQWQPVTINDYATVIDTIAEKQVGTSIKQVVLNLCDGDEVNGTPGISVVKLLAQNGLTYTGADAFFYHITTSKIDMKQAFDAAAVPTPKWLAIRQPTDDVSELFTQLGTPAIVKPSVSGGSMGVGVKNVVNDMAALQTQIALMFTGYRGWQLVKDGLVAEEFINGPEFTVLIVGNYHQPDKAIVYPPVERVFHESLPEHEQFLSFDRLWEIYEDEIPMPNNANFYEYAVPDKALHENIIQAAWDAYVAVKGIGYTRVDIRMDKATGKLYVLEVNAQCGISEDENFTSIGAILRFANISFTELVVQIINNALVKN
jgi:D-alanine-D-alanine ligase